MRTYAIASLLIVALTIPALAKTKYYVVMDTVKNCSVIDAKPSAGMKVLAGGLPSEDAAKKALKKFAKKCAGIVGDS